MPRDIDQIIERLKAEIPGVQINQLEISHPGADDDGLWFITISSKAGEVQIESPDGRCLFLIESDLSDERFHAHNVGDVISTVKAAIEDFEQNDVGRIRGDDLRQSLEAIDEGSPILQRGASDRFEKF